MQVAPLGYPVEQAQEERLWCDQSFPKQQIVT